jgi:hypothetical protein
MTILFIHQRQSKFLHVKGDKEHEILECRYLAGAICTITTDVEMINTVIILYMWSFICSLATSYTLKMATKGLKGQKRRDSN